MAAAVRNGEVTVPANLEMLERKANEMIAAGGRCGAAMRLLLAIQQMKLDAAKSLEHSERLDAGEATENVTHNFRAKLDTGG